MCALTVLQAVLEVQACCFKKKTVHFPFPLCACIFALTFFVFFFQFIKHLTVCSFIAINKTCS